jgi:metallopeptidase MepB
MSQGFTNEDGSRHYPSAAVVANFTPPGGNRPSLLKSDEVVSLFHEVGHALHNLLSKTQIAGFHGTAVPRDFVEVPSKMLEHVFWSRELVRMVSGHFESPNEEQKLPDETLDKLIASRFAYVAQGGLSNMLFSLFDLKIHTPESHEALEKMNLALDFNKLRKEMSLLSGPEDLGFDLDYMQSYCRFRFPIGYSSAYYTYLL